MILVCPNIFLGREQRVVCAFPSFEIKYGLSAVQFLVLLTDSMQDRPEAFEELRDEASFVVKHIEDVSGRFILLKSEVSPESVKEKLTNLSLTFFGKALSPGEHCFAMMNELSNQKVAVL